MSLKIVTIVGARPQFIKAAPVSRALRREHQEYLLHTGQHYDRNMSQLFFEELQIPEPDLNLEIGSGAHGEQTAQMLVGIERVLQEQKPDRVLVYGDTNSTLAGALAAAKLNIPVDHIEAGLRSFNMTMPEEINRILTDRISALLFCPTAAAVAHLRREGITAGVHLTGDVMFDAALHFASLAEVQSTILKRLDVAAGAYLLVTCHRPQNTDHPAALSAIVSALVASQERVIFPVHPRTRGFLQRDGLMDRLKSCERITLIDPVGYLDMIQLEQHARLVVTDSGGVQKEAFFFHVPCVTLREETEWVETVADGWNRLTGANAERILAAIQTFTPPAGQQAHYGDGHASEAIVRLLDATG
ncbi:MAG TPA: UDP-N-acetylglucosamine 2-epimerase (non-hydrolyzing) [bacterium]|nr:UDP-N-acetylglucosamine 2-epimerase (non-hydrolyzing) [bacterium]HQI48309.1 UDP-N-acetylglucosamine 2-epimerase (non-hydrolyzing) [bacterium]HQJ64199.1 UDP-N-acetylglucosamine 2-epimerase (non-hydrolyzing) [bacterium]